MHLPPSRKGLALLLSGAAIGAAGGYAVSASAAGPPTHPQRSHAGHTRSGGPAQLRRAVSIEAVVPTREGAFAKLTIERGRLTSRAGSRLTLSEGTRRHSYGSVTLTLPANAHVRLSRAPSTLSALAVGDRVTVVQAPRRTVVLARPPASGQVGGKQGRDS